MKIDVTMLGDIIGKWLETAVANGVAQGVDREGGTYLTADQVCAMLNVSRPTLRHYTLDGKIKGAKVNGVKWLYDRAEVRRFISERTEDGIKKAEEAMQKRRERTSLLSAREAAMKRSGEYISLEDFAALQDLEKRQKEVQTY